MSSIQAEDSTELAVDPENPWLGLSSYSEETRAYFHGRDDETAELARRVQRKLLTVLFGQSGLGKTSLLQGRTRAAAAPRGLLPGLRARRLRGGFAAAHRSRSSARSSARPPRPVTGRDRAPLSKVNRCGSSCTTAATCCATPTDARCLPLLIFDQFEEIFTLGTGG